MNPELFPLLKNFRSEKKLAQAKAVEKFLLSSGLLHGWPDHLKNF